MVKNNVDDREQGAVEGERRHSDDQEECGDARVDGATAMWEGKHVGGWKNKKTRQGVCLAVLLQSSAPSSISALPAETAQSVRIKIKDKQEGGLVGLMFSWKRFGVCEQRGHERK